MRGYPVVALWLGGQAGAGTARNPAETDRGGVHRGPGRTRVQAVRGVQQASPCRTLVLGWWMEGGHRKTSYS